LTTGLPTFAALIRSAPGPDNRWCEVLIVRSFDTFSPLHVPGVGPAPLFYIRNTGGGRGPSNAWVAVTDVPAQERAAWCGNDPLVVPLTTHDVTAVASARNLPPKSLLTRLQSRIDRVPLNQAVGLTIGNVVDALVQATDVFATVVPAAPKVAPAQVVVAAPVIPQVSAIPAPVLTVPVASTAPVASAGPVVVLDDDQPDSDDGSVTVVVQDGACRKAIVLPPSFADSYIHRAVFGVDDFTVLDEARAKGDSVGLYGPTGSAKTTVAKAYAAARGLPYVQVSGTATMEESRMFGRWIDLGQWQDGVVSEVVRYGGLLILDEINMLPPNISASLFPLLRERVLTLHDKDGETITAHPSLIVIATWNPNYSGTRELNAALANRFGVQVEWGYDDRVEKALGICNSLRAAAGRLRASEVKGEVSAPCPTNALVDFQHYAGRLGLDFAVGNFVARYHDDVERKAVQAVFDTFRSSIENELGLAQATV